MNLNFNTKPEYSLNTSLIDEMIRLYGTPVRLLFTKKIQDGSSTNLHDDILQDPNQAIFNDFKTLKTDSFRDKLEFYVLINDEEYPNGFGFMFNNYGLVNDDTLTVYVSLKSLESLQDQNGNVHPKEIVSNLIIFPNGKVTEITDCQLHVPGINNKFVYSNTPSCYQLSLKSYAFDRSAVDKRDKNDSRIDHVMKTSKSIDDFFNTQDQLSEKILDAAQEPDLVNTNQGGEGISIQQTTKSSKIDDVFGAYG